LVINETSWCISDLGCMLFSNNQFDQMTTNFFSEDYGSSCPENSAHAKIVWLLGTGVRSWWWLHFDKWRFDCCDQLTTIVDSSCWEFKDVAVVVIQYSCG
jgi:hypothetical protein